MAPSSLRPSLRVIRVRGTCNQGFFRARASQSSRLYSQKTSSSSSVAEILSTSAPPRAPNARTLSKQPAWPWRPIPTPKSSNDSPSTIIEERTVFARPLVHSPWLVIGQGLVGLALGGILYYMPDKPMLDDLSTKDSKKGTMMLVCGSFGNTFFYQVCPAAALITFGGILARSWTGARRITRLSQVRIRQNDNSTPATTFLRMQTGWHALLGKRLAPREFKASDAAVMPIAGDGTEFIGLSILPAKRRFRLIERRPYFMDFQYAKIFDSTDKEVVTSVNRLERVFGTLPHSAH